MRHVLCLLAFLVTFSTANLPCVAADELTFEQIRAGYLENRAKFKSMRVSYRWQGAAAPDAINFDLWTDGEQVQVRSPTEPTPVPLNHANDPGAFEFPDTPITPESLAADYQNIAIWSLTGGAKMTVREWFGKGDDDAIRQSQSSDEVLPYKMLGLGGYNSFLPPLFTRPAAMERFADHPYDKFFLDGADKNLQAGQPPAEPRERVIGRERLGNRDTIVVERRLPMHLLSEGRSKPDNKGKRQPHCSFAIVRQLPSPRHIEGLARGSSDMEVLEVHLPMKANQLLRWRAVERDRRLQMVLVEKVWIDPARGYLPLRLETWQKLELDGVAVARAGDFPILVLETGKIDQHAQAAYYPSDITACFQVADRQPDQDAEAAVPEWISQLLATGKALPNSDKPRIEQEFSWNIRRLSINPEIHAGMFALEFPRGTEYFDERFSRAIVTGRPDPLWVAYINNWLEAGGIVLLPLLEEYVPEELVE